MFIVIYLMKKLYFLCIFYCIFQCSLYNSFLKVTLAYVKNRFFLYFCAVVCKYGF